MAWQKEIGSGSNRATGYRDLFVKKVAMMTSQNVATVAINNQGTGGTYVVGDIVTLTHAGAMLDARFEVTAVTAGQIDTLRIDTNGAFSNRFASAVVGGAAGSGYSVGDILELQGGTQREKGKVRVATLSGSAVATVTVFESGGAYSAAPGANDATIGIGPAAFAGDDVATITATMTGLIGLTNLAVTGGGGSGATVDITLAQTGWTVDGRNTNNRTENALTDEKEVVLVGDAVGLTNKPYVGMISWTAPSSGDTLFGIALYGMVAHNASIAFKDQPGLSPNLSSGDVLADNGAYLPTDKNDAQETNFWLSVDDRRILGEININPAAAATDDGRYMNFHMGLMNGYATETENPYPMFIFGPSRVISVDPTSSTVNISCMPELASFTGVSGTAFFYVAETSTWVTLRHSANLIQTNVDQVMFPFGKLTSISTGSDPNKITAEGIIESSEDWSNAERASPSIKLLPVPGTADLPFLWPCNILYRPGGTVLNEILDTPRGELRGLFWVSGVDEAGVKIVNFSEDIVTVGSDRYRVFHTHTHIQPYHYYAIKEDI